MHVCVFLSQSASVEHSHRFLGPSKMADRPGPRRDRTGHQYCHLASHFRCFSAVFPLCSRWIYNHQASGGTARDRAKKCLCMSRQAHASSSCEWLVCSCLKVRQSSILGPSAVQAVQTWRIGLPTETSPLSTHLFPTSPDGQDLCRLLHRSLPILEPLLTHSPPLLTDVAETMTSIHRSGTDTQDGEGVARPPGRMTLFQGHAMKHLFSVSKP